MDQLEVIISNVLARRALLVEQFLREHIECWPGVTRTLETMFTQRDKPLMETVKCSCGAQLEVVILTKLVVQSHPSTRQMINWIETGDPKKGITNGS